VVQAVNLKLHPVILRRLTGAFGSAPNRVYILVEFLALSSGSFVFLLCKKWSEIMNRDASPKPIDAAVKVGQRDYDSERVV
jgi:hypothetical protein